MSVSLKEVEKIAELSKLEFTPQELDRFVLQFQATLHYFTQLEGVSTGGIKPRYNVLQQEQPETPMREDDTIRSFSPEVALSNTPDPVDQHFRVPRVIE